MELLLHLTRSMDMSLPVHMLTEQLLRHTVEVYVRYLQPSTMQ